MMWDFAATLGILFLAWSMYLVYGSIWRLYFSPIAKFPGPRLAAWTRLYELYYELVLGGQYTFKIRDLHKEYGPIIRINPWEIHINDADFYDEIYAGGSKKRDKYLYSVESFGAAESAFATVPHDHHRQRRAPMNKFFSKASIGRLEPHIQSLIDTFCARLEEFRKTKETLRLDWAYACLTCDVICEYCFSQSSRLTENSPNFYSDEHEGALASAEVQTFTRQAPWLNSVMQKSPQWLTRILSPKMSKLIVFQFRIADQIKAIMLGKNEKIKDSQHPTIFHELLASNLPPKEKTLRRLMQEGQIIVGAGTETTAWTLTVAFYHILSNSEIKAKLLDELRPIFDAAGQRPKLSQLEGLPYLTAVVSEALRLSFGVTTHLPRVSPHQPIIYREWEIPPGTPTSMTVVLIHSNPDIFPNPNAFDPERWLANPGLSKYLVSFSRGSRQCLGMNLAMAELYLALSYVAMGFPDMRLINTTIEDVELAADYFIPFTKTMNGVKVVIGSD